MSPQRPEDLQRLIDESGGGWTAGHTTVSELSPEEQKLRLGAELIPPDEVEAAAAPQRHVRAATAAYPTSFDWRDVGGKNFITPVRDQKTCGSCVAFGSLAAVEGTYQVQKNDPNSGIDLSEAQMFYCYAAGEGQNCAKGWSTGKAFPYLKDKGVTTEEYFPYTPGDQACSPKQGWEKHLNFAKDTRTSTTPSEMKEWIATRGPVTARFNVYEDFYLYESGVYHHVTGEKKGGHCVCIVGYHDDTDAKNQYWIVKNSWGPGWAKEKGFFRIGYGECGIDAQMWLVNGVSTG
ncbi:C1 family peptidase [Streptomyces celluloflavus]|uniref:C1 family peptidase n=1 Tax=Streptomyces celluloflavus TaxID=58344 RepID=A0ABW7RBR5_9ACTN|nr:C1 family peptidase [Streptomyces celluloflavus]